MNGPTCAELTHRMGEIQHEIHLLSAVGVLTEEDQTYLQALLEEREEVGNQIAALECGASSNIRIVGLEHTQATQYFRSILMPCPEGDLSGSCPDNSIELVARKSTVLRSYVRLAQNSRFPSVTSVDAELFLRTRGETSWGLPLTSVDGPIVPPSTTSLDRGQADHTLNFHVQGAACLGSLEYRLVVFDPTHKNEAGYSATAYGALHFFEHAELKIRLVRIQYKNDERGFDLPPPTQEAFWEAALFTLKTFPIPGIHVVRDSVELYDGDFTSFFASGGPSAQGSTGTIFEILTDLRERESAPADVLYLAVIPGGPANQTNPGWAVSGRSISELIGDVMAQEIAHNSGFPGHAPCPSGGPAGIDPNYPTYDSYRSGSIGEFGFDPVDFVAYDPEYYADFMGYCAPDWVSPYTYGILLRWFRDASASAKLTPLGERIEPREWLFLSFTAADPGRVKVRLPIFHLEAKSVAVGRRRTPFVVELIDEQQRVLASRRVTFDDPYRTDEDPVLDLDCAVPWHPATRNVMILRDGEPVAHVEVEEQGPNLTLNAPSGTEPVTGSHTISWGVRGKAEGMSFILRYSNDRGKSWLTLVRNTSDTEVAIDFDTLPGGDQCLLQVLASGGVRTAVATSDPLSVPVTPDGLLIIRPHDGATVAARQPILLFGAVSPGDAPPEDVLSWSSSIDGHLGSGPLLVTHTLSVGGHRITLSRADGRALSQSVYVSVRRPNVRAVARAIFSDSSR